MRIQVFLDNDSSFQEFDSDSILIGRSKSADLRLDSDVVSGRHAMLKIRDGVGVISDLQSTNGVYVDGRKVDSTSRITDRSRVDIGLNGPQLVVVEGLSHSDQASPIKASAKENKTLLLASAGMLAVVVCFCMMAALAAGIYWFATYDTISNVKDFDKLSQGIGFVAIGVEGITQEGESKVFGISHGSGFFVTSDGFMFTNEHVVSHFVDMRDKGIISGKSSIDFKKLAKANYGLYKAKPKIWVVVGGVVHNAHLTHVSSEMDFAILKIDGDDFPKFNLSSDDDIEKTTPLTALGFPGVATNGLSNEERIVDSLRSSTPQMNIKKSFGTDSFDFCVSEGKVFRMRQDKTSGYKWIIHDAIINGGNSGGPLCSENGVVVGINTLGLLANGKVSGTNASFTLKQLESEIEQYVPGVTWAKAR